LHLLLRHAVEFLGFWVENAQYSRFVGHDDRVAALFDEQTKQALLILRVLPRAPFSLQSLGELCFRPLLLGHVSRGRVERA